MVRVQIGLIYHYGIYVDDATIVQFGLSPAIRGVVSSDRDVCVCTSDLPTFLQGGALEVGIPDETEQTKLRSPQDVVLAARARLGEKATTFCTIIANILPTNVALAKNILRRRNASAHAFNPSRFWTFTWHKSPKGIST